LSNVEGEVDCVTEVKYLVNLVDQPFKKAENVSDNIMQFLLFTPKVSHLDYPLNI